MANEPIHGFHTFCSVLAESSFGVPAIPTAASALEVIDLNMGPSEQGNIRAKKDRAIGRDMTLAFVEGRVEPIGWELSTSIKSRAGATTVPKESALYKAAGLLETVGGSDVSYSLQATPTVPTIAILAASSGGLAAVGSSSSTYSAQHGRGGIVKSLKFSGGDSELMLHASGGFAGKWSLGQAVGTLIDGSDTTLAIDTAAHAKRMGPGWYYCESEILKVTSTDYTSPLTVTRGEGGSSAVAHASKAVYPYFPIPTLAGSPISESNCTVTIGGTATRCTHFEIDFNSGVDFLPGETGSKWIQGVKTVRYDATATVRMVATTETMALLGNANQRTTTTLVIACGTVAGAIATFTASYGELMSIELPTTNSDIVMAEVKFRLKGSAGSDTFSFSLT